MNDVVVATLAVIGTTFLALAAIGIVRMPDLYCRMQPATKAATLGAMATLTALAVHFGEASYVARSLAGIAFFLLTAPVTAHALGRAAHRTNAPQWRGTVRDELGDDEGGSPAPPCRPGP